MRISNNFLSINKSKNQTFTEKSVLLITKNVSQFLYLYKLFSIFVLKAAFLGEVEKDHKKIS